MNKINANVVEYNFHDTRWLKVRKSYLSAEKRKGLNWVAKNIILKFFGVTNEKIKICDDGYAHGGWCRNAGKDDDETFDDDNMRAVT